MIIKCVKCNRKKYILEKTALSGTEVSKGAVINKYLSDLYKLINQYWIGPPQGDAALDGALNSLTESSGS